MQCKLYNPECKHFYCRLSFQELGKYGVLFYNAFIIIIPTVLASAYTGDLQNVSENIKNIKDKIIQMRIREFQHLFFLF